ncbi:hypothetical protein FQA39_LY07816 [Lamprigera yunnana]|nr:hypothetical protein FQA39_LY07816 [Lamprigera yunnana]
MQRRGFIKFSVAEEIVTSAGEPFPDKLLAEKPDLSSQLEFMEVDTSIESSPDEDTHTSFNKDTPPVAHRTYSKILAFLLIFSVAIVFYKNRYIFSRPEMHFRYLKTTLENNVFGQDEAMPVISCSLDDMIHKRQVKLIALIGTTGVGKTHTANLLKKFFVPEHINDIIIPNFALTNELKYFSQNLIIIDNLKLTNLKALKEFIDKLPKNHRVLVVAIFNMHDVSFSNDVNDYSKINECGIDFNIAIFREVLQETVEKWLEGKLNDMGIDVSRHSEIMKHILSDDHVKVYGFKGLDAKLSVIGKA